MFVYTKFENQPLLFENPTEIVSCYRHSDVKQRFARMESLLDRGFHLAGFFSYEAGYGFEKKLETEKKYDFPLVYMGCFMAPVSAGNFAHGNTSSPRPGGASDFRLSGMKPSLSFENYSEDIKNIRDHISIGNVYQITYCMKMNFSFDGDPHSLFCRLLSENPVPYPAYIDAVNFKILSLSPEMFMRKRGKIIDTKPMKGTWPRGKNMISDIGARLSLKFDKKNRAENLMITDLLRNDLGIIGSRVQVKKLFEVASYRTLHQMTSSVAAVIDENKPLYEIFKALFPSGSVTGAPKIRSMEIIRGLEKEERKIYTGAIGFITPGRDLYFNVPIRTILIKDEQAEMGVGGGIIWDSTPKGEWDESMLKAKFLTDYAS